MTFYFGMLFVVPGTETFNIDAFPLRRESRTIWRIEHVLDLSAIKIGHTDESFRTLTHKARAKAYFLDLLWPGLSQYLDSGAFELAPRFVLYQDDLRKYPRPDKEFIFPQRRHDCTRSIPSDMVMQQHNTALEDIMRGGPKPTSFNELRHQDSPLVWVDSALIGRLLHTGQASTKAALQQDVGARAYVSIWRHILMRFGSMDGKVVLLFSQAAADTLLTGAY